MDNTEVHYLTYDPDEIWNTMMINYVDSGGDILYPGDEKEMLLRSVLADIVQVFAGVDNALRMQTLRYAQGEYLDIIGELRGCQRILQKAATATVAITTNATGEESVISAGTAMTRDGEIFYLLQEDLTLTGYQQTVTAEVIADREGSSGNSLIAGMEMTLAATNSAVNKIVVLTDATGGNEKEEDEAYRTRIREYGLASITTGPEQQYESVAEAVSSDIIDAKALNLGAGKVGVFIILKESTASDQTIEHSVLEALSATNTRPLTDEVAVYLATDIPYTLNVKYSSDNSSATNSAISQAVKDYQEWQDNTIGLAFNPDRLMATLYQAGATRVYWGTGSEFNGDENVGYTQIQENERCKGTITLESITT